MHGDEATAYDVVWCWCCCGLWLRARTHYPPLGSRGVYATFPQIFLFFFPRKTGKAGKGGNISKIWKFNQRAKYMEGFAFQYLEIKFGNMEKKRIARKKNLEI